MPVVPGTCCPPVYYCVDGAIVAQAPGVAPAGTVVLGPWGSLAEAQHGCPVADLTLTCCMTGPKMPSQVWFNLSNVTGFMVGRLPNSVLVTVAQPSPFPGQIAYGSTSVTDSIGDVWNFRVLVFCNPVSNPTGWQVITEITPGVSYYSGGLSTVVSTPVSPWASPGGGGAPTQEKQNFTCAASWSLASPEPVAAVALSHVTYGAGHYDWSVSR